MRLELCVKMLIILIVCIHRASGEEALKRSHYEVLGISGDSDIAEIKKAFRNLALLSHPDKISPNATEVEREEAHDNFLEIQDAYFVLSDIERRRKYDLEREGVTYDIFEDDVGDRYMSGPFSMFAKTRRFRMVFEANFEPNIIPPIMVPLEVNLKDIFTGTTVERVFYRREVCPECLGNGGKQGNCRQCGLCGGSGLADHVFKCETPIFDTLDNDDEDHDDEDHDDDGVASMARTASLHIPPGADDPTTAAGGVKKNPVYSHMTSTTCKACGGKGCHPVGKCNGCGGSGYVMTKQTITMEIPRGAPQGFQIVAQGFGHRRMKPMMSGDVMAILKYNMPDKWSVAPDGVLTYKEEVQLLEFARGKSWNLELPSGETLTVTLEPRLSLMDLLTSTTMEQEGLGLPNAETGERAMLVIEVKADLNQDAFTFEDAVQALEVMGVTKLDSGWAPMMSIFGFKVGPSDVDSFHRDFDESMITIFPSEIEVVVK